MRVPIKGFQKLSLIDYPGKLCATIFLGGCNFRCAYCYNVDLVLRPNELTSIPEEEILAYLSKRKNFLDGLCVGGGEPTLHIGLPLFLSTVKAIGYLIKVDTNGSNPAMLNKLITEKLIDYVAMDVKAPIKDYKRIVRAPVDSDSIQRSIHIIKVSDIDYEFRTTVVPGLVGEKELVAIAKELKSSKRFVIQQSKTDRTLDESLRTIKPYSRRTLKQFHQRITSFFQECILRY